MRLSKTFLAVTIAVVVIALTGASFIRAAHENGEASNGGCDDLYWQVREPAENKGSEASLITASDQAGA